MADQAGRDEELVHELAQAAEAVGRLAEDERIFTSAVEAFRAQDGAAFQAVLQQVGLAERCRVICDWLCSKECVLVCLELCGPPPDELPSPREFAQVVARITADEGLLRRAIDSVEKRDRAAFRRLVEELQIQPFCHLLCHWVCMVRCRLFCEVVCPPLVQERPDPFAELRLAGEAIGRLAANEAAFSAAEEAVRNQDCERLRAVIAEAGLGEHCVRLCWWFCEWRCLLVCLPLCRAFPIRRPSASVREMRASAQAVARIGATPGALDRLVAAVERQDADAFGAVVTELELQRFCLQLCHWICYLVCQRFCVCVCPPLLCELTEPTGCTDEEQDATVGGFTVRVVGSAAGGGFHHYTLEWRGIEGRACDDDTGWRSDGVLYPGGGGVGSTPVFGGILGWIDTTTLAAGSYEVRLCVYPSLPNVARRCCCIQFSLFKRVVYISRVAIAPGAPVQAPPGPFDPAAPVVNPPGPTGIVVPVGGCVTVMGSAFVGDCNNRRIRCIDLRYGLGFLPGPGQPGFNPAAFFGSLLVPTGPVCYTDPNPAIEHQKRAWWNQLIGERALTTRFVEVDLGIFGKRWKLQDFCFNSASLLPVGVNDPSGCPDPQHRCRSGKYTLLLQVEDTAGNFYYDTQQVWFDNKPIYVEFAGLEGLPVCADMKLAGFVPPGAPCAIPWPINLLGIAYDEYIDETDLSYPSDNFDFYTLAITRAGGPTLAVPITPDLVTYGPDPLKGTTRVGEPGSRCEPLPAVGGCPPPPPVPPKLLGLLSKLDLRVFDAVCVGSIPAAEHYTVPPGFPLQRGECCGYTFQVYAQDKTWSDGNAGALHRALSAPWAVCICNDLRGGD